MSQIPDSQPREHEIAALGDECDRLPLVGLDNWTEVRLIGKGTIRGLRACFTPVWIFGLGMVLKPDERIFYFLLNHQGVRSLLASPAFDENPRGGARFD